MAETDAAKPARAWQRHEDELASENWDCSDDIPRRLHYAIFSPRRTGSELLCAYLRQRSLGVPHEYLNPFAAHKIGARLDALNKDRHVLAGRYYERVIAKRTERGIFGIKLQREQLMLFTQNKVESARKVIHGFDRLILMRRRDKLAQAISLARAMLTEQWHVYGNDRLERVVHGDDRFFPMVATALHDILEDEAFIEELVEGFDPGRILRLFYEDVVDEGVREETANWLWDAAGGRPAKLKLKAVHDTPQKIDKGEARAVKERFLARIGVW